MAQVKFYSKPSFPTENVDENGVYFIQGGELYKGSQRFGLGRVTVAASTEGISGMERGDIVVTGAGDGWVYAGSGDDKGWKSLGGNIESLRSSWRSDISTWTAGLVQSGAGSYITGITQDADGKVTASASNFETDVKTAVGGGTASSSANGITVSVTTTSGKVTGVEVAASQITCDTVTAGTATFTDLTVASTATFSATEVSARTLKVGGVDVDNVAASSASGNDAGVAVTVSTLGGGVSEVGVVVTSATLLAELALSALSGKGVATEIRASASADHTGLATEKAVRDALNAFDNAMHFKGVFKSLPETGEAGDIVVIGGLTTEEEKAGELKNGQEYIWDGTKWEKIGDQSAVTGGSSTSTVNNVSVQVVTAAATAAPTVSLTGVGTAATKDFADAVTAEATTLPTCSAVASYVTSITDTKASAGIATAEAVVGIGGTVTFSSNAAPIFQMTVDVSRLQSGLGLGTAAYANIASTITSEGADLPTQSVVHEFVTDLVSKLTSTVSGSAGNVGVTVTQTKGKLTACTVTFDWIEN